MPDAFIQTELRKKLRRDEIIPPAFRLIHCMKKILVLSAVLIGAVSASQAGVLQDIGVSLRLPFLPRVVVRPPVALVPAPVVYPAPYQVCPPTPVIRLPAPPCPPAPVYHGDPRPGRGQIGR